MKFRPIHDSFTIKIIIVTIFVLVVGLKVQAGIPPGDQQQINSNPYEISPSDFSDDPLGDFLSITIPLKRVGRLFLIEANIDNQVGNLIFDT